MHESSATRARDLRQLLRNKVVLRTLLLFCLSASSFALANSLGGLGHEFAASERFVALVAGIGVMGADVLARLVATSLIDSAAFLTVLFLSEFIRRFIRLFDDDDFSSTLGPKVDGLRNGAVAKGYQPKLFG